MSSVVVCSCGNSVPLPESTAKPVRCPACQAVLQRNQGAAAKPTERLIQDKPGFWLYVKDPALIARAKASGGGRTSSLRTFGPGDDPLTELGVRDAEDIRASLGQQEYIAWIGQP